MTKRLYILPFLLLLFLPSVFAKTKLPTPPSGARKNISERKRMEQIYFFDEGKKRSMYGDVNGAVYCFNRAIKADPYCDACYYELSNLYAANNQIPETLLLAQSAYSLDSANVWYAMRLAKSHAFAGNHEQAQRLYEKIIAQNPRNSEAYYDLLMVYDAQRKYAEAVDLISLYQQIFGVDQPSIFSKQSILFKQGNVQGAIAEIRLLTEMYPEEQQHWLMLAELYGVVKSDSLSFDALMQAKNIDSTSYEFQVGISDYYRRLSDFDNYFATLLTLFTNEAMPAHARRQVLVFLQQFPAVEQAYTAAVDSLYALSRAKYSYVVEGLFSMYLVQTQRIDSAIANLKLLTIRGKNDVYLQDVVKNKQESKYYSTYVNEVVAFYESWQLYLDLLLSKQAWGELLHEADNYAEFFPDKYRAFYIKGLALFQQQKYDDSARAWTQAEQSMPSSPIDTAFAVQLYSSLGDLYFRQNKSSKVEKYFEKALKLQPHNVLILNNYAYYLSEFDKKLKKAQEMSKITIDAEPDNATYLDTYAWILYRMGSYEESKKVFQRALVNGGSDEPVMLEHYGDVQYQLNEINNALIYWKKALEKGADSQELRDKINRVGM